MNSAGVLSPLKRSFLLATLAALSVFAWQWTTVHVNYQGNWTALFTIGASYSRTAIAPGDYQFKGSRGYDGQMYRIVAHDPWLQLGLAPLADAPALRYRRLLVPALAWLLAAGRQPYIDAAYFAVILLSVFGGTFAAAEWLRRQGQSDWWALAFPLLPGSLISIDRMTVDVALYALIAGVLACWDRGPLRLRWFLLMLCPLVRDLGWLIAAAAVLWALRQKRLSQAALWASAVLPAACWYIWLRLQLPGGRTVPDSAELPRWLFADPGYGLLIRIFHPRPYPLPPTIAALTQALDVLALSGIVAAVVIAIVIFPWKRPALADWIMLLFAGLYFVSSARGFWADLFSYPRAFTPLLALLAWKGLQTRRAWEALPLLAVTLRVGWQFGRQLEGIGSALVSSLR